MSTPVPEACSALTEIGVDICFLVDNIDFFFAADDDESGDNDKSLSFEEFMTLMLELRGCNTATVKDIVDLRKFITRSNRSVRNELKMGRSTLATQSTDEENLPKVVNIPEVSSPMPLSPPDLREATKVEFNDKPKFELGSVWDGSVFLANLKSELQLLQETLMPELLAIKEEVQESFMRSVSCSDEKICSCKHLKCHDRSLTIPDKQGEPEESSTGDMQNILSFLMDDGI